MEEEGRVVEGGNDRVPHAPASHPHSRISQDIHNKFAGKNREVSNSALLFSKAIELLHVRPQDGTKACRAGDRQSICFC